MTTFPKERRFNEMAIAFADVDKSIFLGHVSGVTPRSKQQYLKTPDPTLRSSPSMERAVSSPSIGSTYKNKSVQDDHTFCVREREELLQKQKVEFEQAQQISCTQHEEEMIKLRDEHKSEVEILMFQIGAHREASADFERERTAWETQHNQLKEYHATHVSTLKSSFEIDRNNDLKLHVADRQNLEREKKDLVEDSVVKDKQIAELVKKLAAKEQELEKVNTNHEYVIHQMNAILQASTLRAFP